jgi:MoaA/NifB/PqqE/SkfB family radical SAM enzyme
MSVLMQELNAKALSLSVPMSVQLDLTYRCNERCVHCYLDHDDHGEMTTAEIKHLLDEMAEARFFCARISLRFSSTRAASRSASSSRPTP